MNLHGSQSRKSSRRALGLIALCAGLLLVTAASAAVPTPNIASVTLVTGASDMYNPDTLVANLDAGNFVAGITWWDHDGDNVVNAETRVGFLWSPASGARAFSLDDMAALKHVDRPVERDWYWGWNRFHTTGISDDGATVGMHLMYSSSYWPVFYPFFWTAADGYYILPLPCLEYNGSAPVNAQNAGCLGGAATISADGGTAVGQVRADTSFETPEKAARWRITKGAGGIQFKLDILPGAEAWSRAWDVNANGSVIVGEAGPEEMLQDAARWVGGVKQNLQKVGDSSIARFTSRDGRAAIGWATIGEQKVLVRWDATGAATIAAPPDGMTIESIQAINPSATAAVGAASAGGFYPNWAPYIWTLEGGFTLIPELGHETEYDASEAMDLSDDGARVVGYVSARAQGPGSSPPQAFLWSRSTGVTTPIADLLDAEGNPGGGYYFAPFISGDGLRILAKGDPDRTDHDTNTVLLTLSR